MKISVNGLNSRMEEKKERVSECEDRTMKITQSKLQRQNKLERKNRVSGTWGTKTKDIMIVLLDFQKDREKR